MKYDIAFSFASEQKKIVEEFKAELQLLGLKVFVDDDHPELFVFNYVPDVLKQIYDDENTAMLIFLSKDYAKKEFPLYEGHIASDRLIKGKKLGIIRVDDTVLPWLPSSLHFFDIRKNDTEYICQAIYQAIKGADNINLVNLFNHLNDNLALETDDFVTKYSSKTCHIYRVLTHDNASIKIVLCSEEKCILFFCDVLCADMSIPFAEISLKDSEYSFYNMGISETDKTIQKFISEEKLLCSVISEIMNFAEKI